MDAVLPAVKLTFSHMPLGSLSYVSLFVCLSYVSLFVFLTFASPSFFVYKLFLSISLA